MKEKLVAISIIFMFSIIGFGGCIDTFQPPDIQGIWIEEETARWNFKENQNLTIYHFESDNYENISWDIDSRYVYLVYDDHTKRLRYTQLNNETTIILESDYTSLTLKRERTN